MNLHYHGYALNKDHEFVCEECGHIFDEHVRLSGAAWGAIISLIASNLSRSYWN